MLSEVRGEAMASFDVGRCVLWDHKSGEGVSALRDARDAGLDDAAILAMGARCNLSRRSLLLVCSGTFDYSVSLGLRSDATGKSKQNGVPEPQ